MAGPVTLYLSYIKYDSSTINVLGTEKSSGSSWFDDAYRTIVLDEPASGDLLAWLQKYATKK